MKVVFTWPLAMLDQKWLPMFAGTLDGRPYYEQGHVKVISFKNCVKLIRAGDETQKIQSVFSTPNMILYLISSWNPKGR